MHRQNDLITVNKLTYHLLERKAAAASLRLSLAGQTLYLTAMLGKGSGPRDYLRDYARREETNAGGTTRMTALVKGSKC